MTIVLVLAHGIPGVASEQPTRRWMDDQLREQLQADEIVYDTGDVQEDQALVEQVTGSSKRPGKPPKAKAYVRDYRRVALRAAKKAKIRQPWMFVRQMAAESGYQPCARSGAGAVGIAQIMPATAESWNVDPYNAEQALLVAARRMRGYEKHYGSYRIALAAYNAGPGAVAQYGGIPPYDETRSYIDRIMDRTYPLPGMRQIYRLPARSQSSFAKRLGALRRDVRRNGGRLHVTESWRSYDDQVRIWNAAKRKYGGWQAARRWAAAPGCSNHGRGYAADLSGSIGMAHRLAPRHGLVFPMSHEPWHIELRGIATQSG